MKTKNTTPQSNRTEPIAKRKQILRSKQYKNNKHPICHRMSLISIDNLLVGSSILSNWNKKRRGRWYIYADGELLKRIFGVIWAHSQATPQDLNKEQPYHALANSNTANMCIFSSVNSKLTLLVYKKIVCKFQYLWMKNVMYDIEPIWYFDFLA